MNKTLIFTDLLIGFLSNFSAQFIQYGNGINPSDDFAAHPYHLAELQVLYNALDGLLHCYFNSWWIHP